VLRYLFIVDTSVLSILKKNYFGWCKVIASFDLE